MSTRLIFNDVTVQYPIYNSRSMSLRNQLVRIGTGGRIENESGNIQLVTALKNVTFQISEGDAVGLIGHNGAGKSTLLRTMAGVYAPTSGSIISKGRVATMLDLGAGMDPELSGIDNIFRMSMLLGLSKAQINASIKNVVDFTELGDFIQLPVRTYSAGMATRLMFAVATSNKPDILLVDEMFGTGDAEFQEKARVRMLELIQSVGIFVFASHSLDMVKKYCNRYFLLEHGSVRELDLEELDLLIN